MQYWTILQDGAVTRPCIATSGPDVAPAKEGEPLAAGEVAVPIDAPPNLVDCEWDGSAWAPSLAKLRGIAWEAVKVARDRAEYWGCATALGRVQTDPGSQRKTSGAVQMAMIAQMAGAPFALDWTMADNSTVTHDAAAMIAMGVAVGQHVAACHEAALARRAAIEAAESAEALAAIDIEGGWPDAPTPA